MRKSLIIVCGDSDRKYATYIQQLISAFDDEGDEIVGTRDGSVDAVVWDEKHYLDNMKKLNSSNHILFIGDTNAAKEARCNMDVRFDELGMSYGWLGTQTFMRVADNSLNKDNYEHFKELCAKYGKSFEKELNMFPVLWTVDPLDWSSRNVGRITEKIVSKTGENDIILMHDYYDTSVTAALKAIDELLEEGYTFVTVEEILFD